MESHEADSPRHGHVTMGETTMLNSKGKLFARSTTKLGLPTAVATFSIAAITFAGTAVASAQSASVPASSALDAQVQLFVNLTKVLLTVARRAWSVCLRACLTVLRAIAEGSGEPTAVGYGRRPDGSICGKCSDHT
jgi:hypothetical protein